MPTPEFVVALREKVGHAPLWLSGVTAIVFSPDRARALFVQRADTAEWTPVTGIIDPLEHPVSTAVREVREEAGIEARVLHLVTLGTVGPMVYQNGDQASYLDLAFACEWISGDPHPADGENTDAAWFSVEQPPLMNGRFTRLLQLTLQQLHAGRQAPELPER